MELLIVELAGSWLAELLAFLGRDLLALSNYLFDATKRLYWGYLIGALLMAAWGYWRARQTSSARSRFWHYLFPRTIYGHPSVRHDAALLLINLFIRSAIWLPLVFTVVPIALLLSRGLESIAGPPMALEWPAWLITFSFTALLFVLDDLSRYWLHRMLHQIPFLWDYHKVHHSAPVLTPLTIYRTHPLESYLYGCRMALAQGAAIAIGYQLFAGQLRAYEILEANAFVFVFNLCGSNLRHSHIWISWGTALERWFISPAQHQLHHSTAAAHRNCNFGSALAIWDRWGGSLIVAQQAAGQRISFGCTAAAHHQNIVGLYWQPLKDNSKRIHAWLLKRTSVLRR